MKKRERSYLAHGREQIIAPSSKPLSKPLNTR